MCITIYEPRVEGGRFAPPNIAGSTSVVTATSKNPEGAFLDARLPHHRFDHGDERSQRQWRGAGLSLGAHQPQSAQGLAAGRSLGAPSSTTAWCAPRLPGMFEMEQALGNEINKAVVGQTTPKEALDAGAKAWREIMDKNGFYAATRRPSISPPSPMRAGSARARRRRSDLA